MSGLEQLNDLISERELIWLPLTTNMGRMVKKWPRRRPNVIDAALVLKIRPSS